MNNTIKEILKEFDEKIDNQWLGDFDELENNFKSFLLSSIKKVVKGCPARTTGFYGMGEIEAINTGIKATQWKHKTLKEIEKDIE